MSIFQLYTKIDADKSNTINRTELASLINNIFFFGYDERQIEIIWNEVDSDGSGSITSKEFIGIFWLIAFYFILFERIRVPNAIF
jgi:Ca2+-binding EF-hand superfamily protein